MATTLYEMGTKWLLKGKLAFINMDLPTLTSEFVNLLPPKKAVIEIMNSVPPTEELIARLQELKAAGMPLHLTTTDPIPCKKSCFPSPST